MFELVLQVLAYTGVGLVVLVVGFFVARPAHARASSAST